MITVLTLNSTSRRLARGELGLEANQMISMVIGPVLLSLPITNNWLTLD